MLENKIQSWVMDDGQGGYRIQTGAGMQPGYLFLAPIDPDTGKQVKHIQRVDVAPDGLSASFNASKKAAHVAERQAEHDADQAKIDAKNAKYDALRAADVANINSIPALRDLVEQMMEVLGMR
jgi:hypothetical protein